MLFFSNAESVFGQTTSINYVIETLPDNSKRVVYTYNLVGAYTDTLVDMKEIRVFALENPSHIMRSFVYTASDYKKYKKADKEFRKRIEKLKNIEELILTGNDTDTFIKKKNNDFKFLAKSSKLKIVRLVNIGQSTLFEKYIKKKHSDLIILQGMAGKS